MAVPERNLLPLERRCQASLPAVWREEADRREKASSWPAKSRLKRPSSQRNYSWAADLCSCCCRSSQSWSFSTDRFGSRTRSPDRKGRPPEARNKTERARTESSYGQADSRAFGKPLRLPTARAQSDKKQLGRSSYSPRDDRTRSRGAPDFAGHRRATLLEQLSTLLSFLSLHKDVLPDSVVSSAEALRSTLSTASSYSGPQ